MADTIRISKVIKVCGFSKEQAEEIIGNLSESNKDIAISLSSKIGEVHICIEMNAADESEGRKALKPLVKEIKSRFGASVYTTDDSITLEQAVMDLLKENEFTITTAESCTGGMLSARIVSVAGVSEIFNEGFITYSNKAKRKYLGVKKSTLVKYGAVSEQTAKEMAKGVCDVTKADVGVGITGIAGPDGGTKEKPVGLVYIGVCVKGKTMVKEYHFKGERSEVRESAATYALIQLREGLLSYFSENTFGKKKSK